MPKPEPFPNTPPDIGDGVVPAPGAGAKVVIVTPAHPTYADVRVFQKEARTLADHGYRVTLFAKAEGRQAPFFEEGIRVVPLAFRSRRYMVYALPGLISRLLKEKADIYHVHNPFSLPLALALKASRRKVIYDVHEDFTRRVLLRRWIPKHAKPLAGLAVKLLEGVVGKVVDSVIVSQPDVAERIGSKALVILNAPVVTGTLIGTALAYGAGLSEAEIHRNGTARLVYIGGISRARGLFEMVRLLERLNVERPARLWLLGNNDAADLLEARTLDGWRYVDFLGLRPQHEALGHIARSDLALALLLDEGGHSDASPNKLYEYMTFGTPFVASDYAFWREGLPEKAGGIFVDPEDPHAPLAAIQRLLSNKTEADAMGELGRRYVTESFNWERESEKLLGLYASLLART